MDPLEEEVEQLKHSLPKSPYLNNNIAQLINYQDFWLHDATLLQTIKFQRYFQARDSDLLITSLPKTGTTWLKALLFATTTRSQYPMTDNPLLKTHSHELVLNLEYDVYGNAFEYPGPQQLDELPSPRLFNSHLPYTLLPGSIRESKCKVLYICRNPLDTMVSLFHFTASFFKKLAQNGTENHVQPPCFEDIFEEFCRGRYIYGPFFEHTIGYWKMSLERPDKVLFLKYEELKDDPSYHLKRVAEFVDMPFSPKEESEGVIEQIIQLCSIGNMKELEVNKSGVINKFYGKDTYFRKGEVGDWRNHFTPTMAEKITKLMEEKLEGTGLSFNLKP